MTALLSSNRLQRFNRNDARTSLSPGANPEAREPYWSIEIRRSLCRWENEGGAVVADQKNT